MQPWKIKDNLIFLTVHGSMAYGTNTGSSDLDVKGICLVPGEVRDSLFHRFDQAINDLTINSLPCVMSRINPFNPKIESTIYSLGKFFQLAAAVNPNIIELLWTDTSDILYTNGWGEIILVNRDIFLSKKAKFTFQGYAFAQAAKIERHRKWLINPPQKCPERKDYHLPDAKCKEYDVIWKLSQKQIEHWSLSHLSLDTDLRNGIKEETFDLINSLASVPVDWGNWPQKYTEAALAKILNDLNLGESFDDLIGREYSYQSELRRWKNYLAWKDTRNKERAKLEEKCQYDSKHAAHLIRLARMGVEILRDHKVNVKRPDFEDLKYIRDGNRDYDDLMVEFAGLNKQMDDLYKTSTLRNSVDFAAVDDLYFNLIN